MPIQVMLCCNDDNGSFTGMAHRIDFNPYELCIEETVHPPRGVRIDFPAIGKVRIGLRVYPIFYHQTCVGNIYWDAVSMRGVYAFQVMNYLMRLKHWRASSGETFLFDKFNAKQRIDPHDYFAWQRQQQERTCPDFASADVAGS